MTVGIILGLLLLLLLLVLFVPVRYKVDASMYGKPDADFKISWLGVALCAKGGYHDKKLLYYVRSFFLLLMTNDENKKPLMKKKPKDDYDDFYEEEPFHKDSKKNKKDKGHKWFKKKEKETEVYDALHQDGEDLSESVEDTFRQKEEASFEEISKDDASGDSEANDKNAFDEEVDKWQKEDENEEKEWLVWTVTRKFFKGLELCITLPPRIVSIMHFLLVKENDGISFVWDIYDNISGKLRDICKKKDKLVKLWRLDTTKDSVATLKFYAFDLLKHLAPKKAKGRVRFGFDDPAVTGQTLGFISFFLPLYHNRVAVIPDFQNKVIEGEIHLKGHITIFYIIKVALKLYFDKKIRKTRERFDKIMGRA
ncbi:MAG: DUF2953 domain-containing protein [Lachnospiraceae bacterium]|nr:DUF2953 domain-containing protein [Lachnospiraceae bacterium]